MGRSKQTSISSTATPHAVALRGQDIFQCGVEYPICCQLAMPARWWFSRKQRCGTFQDGSWTGVAEIRCVETVTGGQDHVGRRMAVI
jgi:hypothetical protein